MSNHTPVMLDEMLSALGVVHSDGVSCLALYFDIQFDIQSHRQVVG